VSDQVRRQAQGVFFGAFYEPVVTDWRRFGTPAAAREREAELLRAQVQDFVDWLKAQGAI
jgi:hypothetical protein